MSGDQQTPKRSLQGDAAYERWEQKPIAKSRCVPFIIGRENQQIEHEAECEDAGDQPSIRLPAPPDGEADRPDEPEGRGGEQANSAIEQQVHKAGEHRLIEPGIVIGHGEAGGGEPDIAVIAGDER